MKKNICGYGKGLITLLAILCGTYVVNAQVGVGTATPHPSAQLEVAAENKGLLIPRVTSTALIVEPANGLMVYQTGDTAGFYYNSGTSQTPDWVRIATGSAELADGAVTEAKIAAGAVSTNKLAVGAVDNTAIAYGAITPDKISSLNAMPNQVLTNGTTGVTWATPSGGSTPMFSAYLPALTTAASTQLTDWTITSPFFTGPNFDPQTGNFTVPATGRYQIDALVNYSTTATISVSLGAGVYPSFVVRRTSPTTTDLAAGMFPIMDVNIALVLNMRTIMASAAVPVTGTVELTAGDVIGLFYVADGLTIPLNLGGNNSAGINWSITRVQ